MRFWFRSPHLPQQSSQSLIIGIIFMRRGFVPRSFVSLFFPKANQQAICRTLFGDMSAMSRDDQATWLEMNGQKSRAGETEQDRTRQETIGRQSWDVQWRLLELERILIVFRSACNNRRRSSRRWIKQLASAANLCFCWERQRRRIGDDVAGIWSNELLNSTCNRGRCFVAKDVALQVEEEEEEETNLRKITLNGINSKLALCIVFEYVQSNLFSSRRGKFSKKVDLLGVCNLMEV